jgi:hypothetical protein
VGDATIFDSQQVATVTTTSSNVLDAGIPIYANTLNISSANAFMTVFFIVLISVAVALGIAVVALLTTIVLVRFGLIKHERAIRLKETLPTAIKSWFLRLVSLVSHCFFLQADKRTGLDFIHPCYNFFLLPVDVERFVAFCPLISHIVLVNFYTHLLLRIFGHALERF